MMLTEILIYDHMNQNNWDEPERAPHRRVGCGISLYMYIYLVRRAVSHIRLLFCVHQHFVASHVHVHATLLSIILHEIRILLSVYLVIVYNGLYKHLKLFAEQRRQTST